MSSKQDSALRLFEELDGLADTLIEEGMLDESHPLLAPKKPRHSTLFGRFMKSGPGVAILCGLLYLGIMAAVVRFGGDPSGDSVTPPPGNGAPTEESTRPVTQEPPTAPEEEDQVDPGITSEDENGLIFVSNGDGTCTCKGFTKQQGQTVLKIPNNSPDGDIVTAIDPFAFRSCYELEEVILPDGLREFDHMTFPMEAEIYTVYGNILYLGSHSNPYLVAVATTDNRPGSISLNAHTRLVACHAFTYDTSAYFALHWKDKTVEFQERKDFIVPSSVQYLGEYALTDVGKNIIYGGFLVGWDTLTGGGHRNVIRTVEGEPVTVKCLDGTTTTLAQEPTEVRLSALARLDEYGAFYSGYLTYAGMLNPDYYAWLRDPAAFEKAPDQFITVTHVYGREDRILTPEELRSVFYTGQTSVGDELTAFMEAYNADPVALYRGQSVAMLLLEDLEAFYEFRVAETTVTDRHVHVVLEKLPTEVISLKADLFILVPVGDPAGKLAGATVSYEILEPPETEAPTEEATEPASDTGDTSNSGTEAGDA